MMTALYQRLLRLVIMAFKNKKAVTTGTLKVMISGLEDKVGTLTVNISGIGEIDNE